MPSRQPVMLCRWTTSTRKDAQRPPTKSGHGSPSSRTNSNVRTVPSGLVRLDLPARADRDREVVTIVVSRRVDQCARMVLGAAAVAVDHVQHTVRRRRREGIGHALEG